MKRRSCLFAALIVLSLFFGALQVFCQEVALQSNKTDLPNAPSTTPATTCTENSGGPCPEWVHKMVGQYPPLPESRKSQQERDPSSVHLWTYRRSWQDPPLRTNKQVFRSKVFMAVHIGGAIAMIVACRTKGSGEDWGSEAPAVAAMFGMDYLQYRFVGGPNGIGPAVYEMIHYSLASTK